jgi:hypothetical protein
MEHSTQSSFDMILVSTLELTFKEIALVKFWYSVEE